MTMILARKSNEKKGTFFKLGDFDGFCFGLDVNETRQKIDDWKCSNEIE